MSEFGNAFDLPELEDGDLDIAAIFGAPGAAAAVPPPAPEPASEPEKAEEVVPEAEPAAQKGPTPAQSPEQESPAGEKADTDEGSEPDLFAALAPKGEPAPTPVKSTQDAPRQVSLFDKPPILSYGGSKEEIKDASMTFEELRIAKADDFPELAEGKKVSWTVTYGKVNKYISDPKGTAIAGVKEEIEKSKTFLDGLKKAAKEKDRSPDCLVTPKVTAQSKGIASYKGVFATVDDAQASDKTICLIPSRDGRIYELRKTEMGDFIAPKHKIVDFSAVRAGFTPALPLIPRELIGQIISFFRCFMNEREEFEALAHIYWDKEQEEYTVFIPRQRVSKARIDADLRGSALQEERYIHYADIHSHNSMAAKFSYLQHVFPHLGVRFIAISDGYDSADASTFDRLTVALKNIVNNIYSKDISLKSGGVLREKQARGEFIGAYASYGYIKDPRDRHRIIPDPETAQVVREIYRRKLEGQGDTAITRWLNASGILSPSCYRYQKGIIRDERYAQPKPWLVQTVKNILRSEVYLGHMVQGRRICEFYANRPDRMLPQDEWTVVKNTHEPLVSQEDFDRVQEINRKAKAAYHENLGKYDALGKTENLLKGLVFCADCGRPLVRYKQVTSKGKYVHYYYLCPNYAAQLEHSGCTYKFVPEEKLIGAVEAIAAKEILLAADLKVLAKQKAAQHTAAAEEAGRALKGALAEQNKLHALRERLLRDYLAKLMDQRDYERIRAKYQAEEDDLNARIKELCAKQREEKRLLTQDNPWFTAVTSCSLPFSLTRETAKLLIERITVYDNARWEITFRFRDERQAILEDAMREGART